MRTALKLKKGDNGRYTIRPNGEAVLRRSEGFRKPLGKPMSEPMSEPIDKPAEVEDPVIKVFLDFLAKDMANHPEQLQVISASLAKRLQSLADDVVDDVAVDLDAPLSPDDE